MCQEISSKIDIYRDNLSPKKASPNTENTHSYRKYISIKITYDTIVNQDISAIERTTNLKTIT